MNETAAPTRTIAYHHLLAALLILFSVAMSAYLSERVFERLPHLEDEVAYLWQAKLLARGQTVIDSPLPRRAFWQPFIVDFGENRFGKYTLGWPLILAPGVLVGQPWLVNALLAGLTVFLVYRLGLEIFNPDVGVIGAALAAFSPMALLLSGTLMGHTAALCTTMLFMFAYWRMERGEHALRWGVIAGIALGFSVINRPLAGLALALPFVAWSGTRLLKSLIAGIRSGGVSHAPNAATDDTQAAAKSDAVSLGLIWAAVRRPFIPLFALAVVAALIMSIIPAYNYAATGDASKNLYTLVWDYDRVGFGEDEHGRYGRNIHTLEKGLRQTRWDLSLTAADLFGWQSEPLLGADGEVRPELRQHLLNDGDYWMPVGLSWILLPFGLLLGFRRAAWFFAAWLVVGILIFMHSTNLPLDQLRDPQFAVRWMAGAVIWVCVPFLFLLLRKSRDSQSEWTYLLLAFALFLVLLHIAYWIGSQRYSTRYYFEMLGGLAIISALPLAWLARRVGRWPVYIGLAALLLFTLFSYSLPRIGVLHRFNWVSPDLIQAVEARREGDRPVVVVLKGSDVRWRAVGPLMAVTHPLLDSPIVAAIDNGTPGYREQILAHFPDRQVIDMTAVGNTACFGDKLQGECYGEPLARGT